MGSANFKMELITVRVNVDESALTDPRFKRLARYLSITIFEAIGRCVPVWMTAYNRRSAILTIEDIDIASDRDGFAETMVRAELAEQLEPDRVRLRGVADRIQFLLEQQAKARKRWGNAGGNAPAHADASAPALPGLSQGRADGDAYSLDQDQFQDQDPAVAIAAVAIAEINRLAGARYETTGAETVKNSKTLAKRGITAADVPSVIAAKWAEWSKSDQMRTQFKPSVLLRPSNFAKYREDLEARVPSAPVRRALPTSTQIVLDDDTIIERRAS